MIMAVVIIMGIIFLLDKIVSEIIYRPVRAR